MKGASDGAVRAPAGAEERPRRGGARPFRGFGGLLGAVGVTFAAACGASSDFGPMAPAPVPGTDLPTRFEPLTEAQRIQPGDTLAGPGCLSPMVDPRSDDRYLLVRSGEGLGDYRVPEGRYGAERDDFLRLECNTGRPLGLVRR